MSIPANCAPVDLFFRESEQRFTNTLEKYRTRPSNGFWGKIKQVGNFPIEQGTTIKDQRLPRVVTNAGMQWEGVKDNTCETNLCATDPTDRLKNPGWVDEEITLQKAAFDTDWICIDAMTFRRNGKAQLMHILEGAQQKVANEWDDKLRIEYYHAVENKRMAYIPADTITDGNCDCAPADCSADNVTNGNWMFYTNPDVNGVPGQVNPDYILVAIDPSATNAFERIGLLTTDMFDEAALDLDYADENKPMIGEGIDLYDVLLADVRMGRDFFREEDESMNNAMSYGGYNTKDLVRVLGTKGVLRSRYSIRYDKFALKYWPDTDYNTDLAAEEGYAFDETDPTTWARLKRVKPYYEYVNAVGGIEARVDPFYLSAPFGISGIISPQVIQYLGFPESSNIASAVKQGVGTSINYAGNLTWFNPDWPCNLERNKGFWKAKFGMAVKRLRPEFGNAWLHRISSKIQLRGACCPIGTPPCRVEASTDCFGTTSGDEAGVSGERGANTTVAYRGAF